MYLDLRSEPLRASRGNKYKCKYKYRYIYKYFSSQISDQNLSDPPVATAERPVVLGGDGCTLELVCNADGEL